MAPDKRISKRKAAPVAADSPAKKTKKVEAKAAEAPKEAAPKSILKKETRSTSAKAEKAAAPAKANGETTRQVKPRKRAADFLTDEENEAPAAPVKAEKKAEKKPVNKKSKKEEVEAAPAPKKAAAKKAAPKTTKKPEPVVESEEEDVEMDASPADESEAEVDGDDDQTEALIKGFESSGDEDESDGEGYKEGEPIPKVPDTKKAARKLAKQLKKNGPPEEPGTVYIGRIPHGFYEHQMKAYFSQFGDITNLRLSRNRLTGRSKHYAFIEFSSTTVAKIVADTMDNYLMYGHIVKCKFVPKEQLHPEVWKGANRRFKVTPWNRIEKKRLEKGKTREQWEKRIESEQKKREAKANKMKALGYEIDLPQLRSVEDVPIQEAPKAVEAAEATETTETIEAATEEPAKAIEAPAPTEDTPKKAKKGKKTETPKEAATESPAAKSPAAKSPAAKSPAAKSPATKAKGKVTKKTTKKSKA
ncbi:Nucleotide-binding alpha-beta plait [Penicillium paradoxum]|uniref:Nucleotide-binding alpha-beta plait n=1 Tax=Penicillium paradoxum TaxID=176176 RepID=UPI002549AADB|nr:Nucleotide-binding alpha-beta plait [Penicillium paradoxum]KAJ5787353.1 Nucleotide-binding alpha-beta plait [Penicillium paradoxum]